ncbi:single-stranded DNA-binding protein [Candidatus Saccharibacteria bacterium]|nr:single-stranded DNA-binding protein [Candidatus Saccharibacteria bacterium]
MRGFSKAIITGNLTRDPELRTTPSGASVCSFSVAINRVYRDANGEQKEDVSFIDCSAWGKLGEMINQYAKRGSGVLVSGRLDQRSWEDKNTGQKRSRVEIVVEDFNFTGNSNRDGGNSSYQGNSSSSAEPVASGAEDIPDDIPEGEIDLSEVPF